MEDDNWTASPLLWRPIFAQAPRLAAVSPHARELRAQLAHFSQLIAHIPATFDESNGIFDAFQLCERLHGFPAVAEAVQRATRLCIDALPLTRTTLTALAAQRGYATAGLWVGALVERAAGITPERRHFPRIDTPPRWGSPHIEFEDIERALDAALALGEISLRNLRAGALQPFASLAAALRIARGEEGWRALAVLTTGSRDVAQFARLVRAEARAHSMALPVDWLWLEAALRPLARRPRTAAEAR